MFKEAAEPWVGDPGANLTSYLICLYTKFETSHRHHTQIFGSILLLPCTTGPVSGNGRSFFVSLRPSSLVSCSFLSSLTHPSCLLQSLLSGQPDAAVYVQHGRGRGLGTMQIIRWCHFRAEVPPTAPSRLRVKSRVLHHGL